MKRILGLLVLLLAVFLLQPEPLFAEYTLVLKNGRRITVQSYREEGNMVKFSGFGGEIGIAKDQIQTILKPGEGEAKKTVVSGNEIAGPDSAALPEEAKKTEDGMGKEAAPGKVQTPEEQLAEERAKEEKEYQRRMKELTERIKALTDRYAAASRGGSSAEPNLFTSEEAFRGHQDDLLSRLRDAQHNPQGPSDAAAPKVLTPSPFSGVPPSALESSSPVLPPGPTVNSPLPGYSDRQKELSDLRNQISQLMKQREALIEEMKAKNFDTGSLFLD